MANRKNSPLVEFVRGEPRIEVFAAEKSQTSASRYLYGKFAEHLWSNVYNGMWAQILHNTGFEPDKYFSHGDEDDRERRLGWTEYATGLKGLVESYKDGVAFGWAKYGDGDATYSLDTDRVNSDTSQKVVVRSLQSPEVGVQQPIYLPLHRTNKYELSVWVKVSAKNLYIAIRTIDGRQLGKAEITGVTPEWKKHTARLDIDRQGIEQGQALVLTLGIREPGTLWLDQCFLFPTDHKSGFDPDIIRMLRNSKLPLLRFPGGNFASGYHWQDGIGPIDRRPIRMNPAWSHDEPNHVGTDEWLKFCELVGCEPLICVNAGNGTPEEAAAWVEYCNGSTDTKYGALRAENGHPKPYNVKLWEIGNELYGSWQIGHCTPEEYAERYERFYKAMSAVDPTIKFIANGQYPEWNAPIIERNAKILRSLSIHCLMGEPIPAEANPEAVFRSYMALPVWFEGYLRSLGKQMTDGGVADPHIALTELQMFTKKRELPNNQTMTEALFYAGMVNTGIRLDGLLELITHSALVNHGAGLRKDHEIVFANPVHWAHHLYSTQPGERPVRVRISSPQFSVEQLHDLPTVENVPYLDAVALLDNSGRELNMLVTNRHPKKALAVEIGLDGFTAEQEVQVQTLAGADYMARNSWEHPDAVRIVQSTAKSGAEGLTYTFPASSITHLRFKSDILALASHGKTLYISKLGNNTDGSSWANAFTTIQTALNTIPDDRGGHRIIIRPDTYFEAMLYPSRKGAEGAYNEIVGDVDGSLGSGAAGWVVIDSSDPKQQGFKSYDWWGPIRSYSKGWSPEHTESTFSAIGWDRWKLRNLYVTGGDSGVFFDLTDQVKPFTVIVEDCVGIGRAFGGGVASCLSRHEEPITFRRCHLWALDWWGDTAGAYVRVENQTMPDRPDVVFEDCTMVSPQCALKSSNFGFHTSTHVKLTRCHLITLNFSQPQGTPTDGIIQSVQEGKLLCVDIEDCTLMGYKVFGVMVKKETVGDIRYTTKGDVKAYVQFQQQVPKGFHRLPHFPVEVFQTVVPPSPKSPPKLVDKQLIQRDLCELSPFIWKGRLYYMECVRPASGGAVSDYYLLLKEAETGKELARCAEGYGLASVIVHRNTLYIYASKWDNGNWQDVTLFKSSGLKHWESRVVVQGENEGVFNTSVCRGRDGFVMAYESDDPAYPPFTVKFAQSFDLERWTKIPEATFGTNRYTACPCIRYADGWYYVLYLEHRTPRHVFETYVTRSKDLRHWELSAANPVLRAEDVDEGINASDPEIVEFKGKTYVYFSVGDQLTWMSIKRAAYPGRMADFLKSWYASPGIPDWGTAAGATTLNLKP